MKAIDDLIQREGGYVNHPGDKGGPTKYGITESVARSHGYNGNMQDLPREMAERIYLETYYHKTGFSRISNHAVAEELLDSGVLHGPARAVSWLQTLLNSLGQTPELKVDGGFGSVTLGALESYLARRKTQGGDVVLVRGLNCLQGAYMIGLGDYAEPFLFGWLRTRVAL